LPFTQIYRFVLFTTETYDMYKKMQKLTPTPLQPNWIIRIA
jgi:hypothetical protein